MPQFKVLGTLEVTDGKRICTPSPPKIRAVLALLVLRANRIVSVESLIEELWGTDPPPSAVTTVQTYIYHLRRMFVAEGLDPPGGQLIATKPAGYLIWATPEQVDALVFERLLASGRDASEEDRPEEAAVLLRQALDLWTGSALADVPQGNLLQAHAIHLEELRIGAIELRIRADIRLGRHHALVAELRSLVWAHPLNEWFHGQLIAALSRCGRRGEALKAYQEVRAVLSNELGVDPSPALQRLQRQVLSVGVPEPAPVVRRPKYAAADALYRGPVESWASAASNGQKNDYNP
jgi:SARP family transcriptional regulator, regulator of embCAB operon